jgi:hypothetical protein
VFGAALKSGIGGVGTAVSGILAGGSFIVFLYMLLMVLIDWIT